MAPTAAATTACTTSTADGLAKLSSDGGCPVIAIAAVELRLGGVSSEAERAASTALHLTQSEVMTALEAANLDITSSGTVHIVGPLDAPPTEHSLRFQASPPSEPPAPPRAARKSSCGWASREVGVTLGFWAGGVVRPHAAGVHHHSGPRSQHPNAA
jgi:hypothetical protein